MNPDPVPTALRNLLATLVILLPVLARAQGSPQRVFPDGVPPDDRLHTSHDVDHPVMFDPHFADSAAWAARANRLREQVAVAEGLWPTPEKTPLNAVVHGSIDRDDYTVSKVFLSSLPGHYVSGNLYRPKNRTGKLPAVLSPHGHWPGGRFYENGEDAAKKQIELGAEKTMEGARYPIQARCAMLARMGCVVFQYDMVGYADSTAIPHRTGFTDAESILRLQSFMGLQSWNSVRALDFIESLDDVDPNRVAVTGASGGGTQTIVLSTIDDRLAVAFPAVMVSEQMQGGCVCENAPLLRVGTNNVELIGTFAPKPLAMSAANDWTRWLEINGLPQLKSLYKLYNAEDNVAAKHFSFEHNYNQVSREMMYNWFNKHLKLGWPEPAAEKPFVPIPPKELSVYDDAHPRPADTADAKTLRQTMTRMSDRQMDALFKSDPAGYRKTVRAALRAMVNDELPSGGTVSVSNSSGPVWRDGVLTETGAMSRRGAGEAVPFASMIPAGWNGAVTIVADPAGKSVLFADDDGKPSDLARKFLDRNEAVIGADLFLTGEFVDANHPAKPPGKPEYEQQDYAGFLYGYNRGVLADRVHDLLTAVALAKNWHGARSIDLLGRGESGPVALLARCLAGSAVRRAAIDLNGFDYTRIKDSTDPMMLPGALKYGGTDGFLPLCDSGETLLTNPPPETRADRRATAGVKIEPKAEPSALEDWLTR